MNSPHRARASQFLKTLRTLSPLFPVLLLLIALYVFPILRTIYLSLNGAELDIGNYQKFFSTPAYLRVLGYTLGMSILVTFLCIAVGYPVAYLIATSRKEHRSILIFLVMIPWLTNELIRNYIWLIILNPNGIINQVLMQLNIISQPLRLAGTSAAILVAMVYVQMPLSILPVYSVMQGVDMDLLRVAQSLGATQYTVIRNVLIPLTMPGVIASGILLFLTSVGFYVTPALLGADRDIFMANLISIHISRLVQWEYGSAMSIIFVLSAFACVILVVRLARFLGISSLDWLAGEGLF